MASCQDIHVQSLPVVGAEIDGLDTAQEMHPDCQEKLISLFHSHSVLLFRNQNLTEEALLRIAMLFGEPKPAGSRGYYMRAGNPHGSGRKSPFPHVSIMSNLDEDGNPLPITGGHGSQAVDWHQDDSYTNEPARGALLYNTAHPISGGGNTSFCNLYTAYETLPPDTQKLVETLHLVHDISRNSAGHVRPGLTLPATWDDVEGPAHPLVIQHPLTQRKALHLGRKQPPPTSYIYELPGPEGHALLDYLWNHATSKKWTHDTWVPGDLLMWDNLATMHSRSSVDHTQKREMYRVLLRGAPLKGSQSGIRTIPTAANNLADQEARAKDFSNVDTAMNMTCAFAPTAVLDAGSSLAAPGILGDTSSTSVDNGKLGPIGACCLLVVSVLSLFAVLYHRRKRSIHKKSAPQETITSSQKYLAETRVRIFWMAFLIIYLCFYSFSCGRADRLWRISDVFDAAPPVLLKPYGISYLWYASLAPYMRSVENAVLTGLIALALPLTPKWLPRRWLSLMCGMGFLYLHAYEHSLTGGSHTHLMPAICMMALALPPLVSISIMRQWNVFLLFSAGLCKLFNGNHHPWWAWMDGQSMQFYFENSREAVPEPWNSWTMNHDWFAALQCTGSAIFELSTFLLLFSRTYRLVFPILGAAFHGMIWYTLGVNYLTSVVIQFTLVLDAEDWRCALQFFPWFKKWLHYLTAGLDYEKKPLRRKGWVRIVEVINAGILILVAVRQYEFWPLSNIPMYSGYRPREGYNITHIANRTYLDNLINECAPHVWSRHWTDVVVTDLNNNTKSKLGFCAPSRVVKNRGVRDVCLIPNGDSFDTERDDALASEPHRLVPPVAGIRHSMRPGGWNRQKPIVIMAELPGRYHVYCKHDTLSPVEDWLYRNCAFLHSIGVTQVKLEMVVHLGTGDLTVGPRVDCSAEAAHKNYPPDQVPQCIQSPWP